MRGKTIERASTPIAKTSRIPNGQRYIRTVPAADAFLGGVGLTARGQRLAVTVNGNHTCIGSATVKNNGCVTGHSFALPSLLVALVTA